MALHFSDTKSFSRKDGKSAVASIAYRAGEKLFDERQNKTQNYSKRHGVMSADIILPSKFSCQNIKLNRQDIWNKAEQAEKRKDARVAREWLINLPYELDEETRKKLAHSFAQKLADRYNVLADCCIHQPTQKEIAKGADPRNFHAHIMLTTRELEIENGEIVFTKKSIAELSDTDRKKLGLCRMNDELKQVKKLWDDTANPVLIEHGFGAMDHRSYKEVGLDIVPQVKMGVHATQIERKGGQTCLGDINREIKQRNEIVFNRELEYIEKTNARADEIIFESRKKRADELQKQAERERAERAERAEREALRKAAKARYAKADAEFIKPQPQEKERQIDQRGEQALSKFEQRMQQHEQQRQAELAKQARLEQQRQAELAKQARLEQQRQAEQAEQARPTPPKPQVAPQPQVQAQPSDTAQNLIGAGVFVTYIVNPHESDFLQEKVTNFVSLPYAYELLKNDPNNIQFSDEYAPQNAYQQQVTEKFLSNFSHRKHHSDVADFIDQYCNKPISYNSYLQMFDSFDLDQIKKQHKNVSEINSKRTAFELMQSSDYSETLENWRELYKENRNNVVIREEIKKLTVVEFMQRYCEFTNKSNVKELNSLIERLDEREQRYEQQQREQTQTEQERKNTLEGAFITYSSDYKPDSSSSGPSF